MNSNFKIIERTHEGTDFKFYEFSFDDYIIPYIRGSKVTLPVAGHLSWTLSLDGRYLYGNAPHQMIVSNEQLEYFLWFLSNAMAVAAGWSSFGKNSVLMNKFGANAVQRFDDRYVPASSSPSDDNKEVTT